MPAYLPASAQQRTHRNDLVLIGLVREDDVVLDQRLVGLEVIGLLCHLQARMALEPRLNDTPLAPDEAQPIEAYLLLQVVLQSLNLALAVKLVLNEALHLRKA